MTELVELNSSKHKDLKVAANCAVELAAGQHVMNIRVAEVGKAVSSFPVFFTRISITGDLALSAITGLEQGRNLFVEGRQWTANYQPTGMQTYPMYLMRSPTEENSYTVGIDEQNKAFSKEQGEALFDDKGKASLYLSKVTALLEADIKHDIQTYQFAKKLEELELLNAVDILVHYEDGTVHTLKGLHTLGEDKLQALSAEQLAELNQKGYLAPIYAMLISIYQLNSLINKHNQIENGGKIKQIKMEVAKDATAA